MKNQKVAIFSDDISGSVLAHILQNHGCSVLHYDLNSSGTSNSLKTEARPYLLPNTELLYTSLQNLSSALNINIDIHTQEVSPQTFKDSTLVPFVGFGESKSAAITPLSEYNYREHIETNPHLQSLIADVTNNSKIKTTPIDEISSIVFDKDKVSSVVISGSQEVLADEYIFLSAPTSWINALPATSLSSRVRGRLAKSSIFARVGIEFQHDEAYYTHMNPIFLLPNQPTDDPCVGQFYLSASQNGSVFRSSWETYIAQELCDDTDYLSTSLKNLRKQARRAFPQIGPHLQENIAVIYDAYSDLGWIKDSKDFNELANNIHFAPVLMHKHLGLARCVISVDHIWRKFQSNPKPFLSNTFEISEPSVAL